MSGRRRAVIIGAGALGLGFLGERMAPDYELCLVDLASREQLLRRISAEGGYTMSLCGSGGIELHSVPGSFSFAAMDLPEGPPSLTAVLEEADLVLTAVGSRALPGVVARIAPILNAREARVWLLFCENGLDIAERHRGSFAPHVTAADTVMSRMCRFAEPDETGYAGLWPGSAQCLVAESFPSLPLDRSLCEGGPFSAAFDLLPSPEFRMWEDIKLFMHNGLHAYVSYHAYLAGTRRLPDVPAAIRVDAERVMRQEIAPAIVFHHPEARRERIEAYGLELLGRFVDRQFNDSIERGIRGAQEKLAPGERLLGGRDYIREAGIEPRGYATVIDAAREIVRRRRREAPDA